MLLLSIMNSRTLNKLRGFVVFGGLYMIPHDDLGDESSPDIEWNLVQGHD